MPYPNAPIGGHVARQNSPLTARATDAMHAMRRTMRARELLRLASVMPSASVPATRAGFGSFAVGARSGGAASARIVVGASAAVSSAGAMETRRGVSSSARVGDSASSDADVHHLLKGVDASKLGFHDKPLPLRAAGGLKEYSVVYTDRALNHMSAPFCDTMKNLDRMLKSAYNATSTLIMPGSGTYGMEAVARQWCSNKKALVIRNGYFSYRWTDIFEQTNIPSETIVMRGRAVDDEKTPAFAPPPIAEVVAMITKEKPAVVFAPHVETSTGIILPDDYIKGVADAVHAHGGLFVLDCIASGTVWVDMKATGVDAILSAPQKGWTGPACASVIMLSERGTHATRNSQSTSMVINMRKWLEVMDAYLGGGFAYYTTMPTDALTLFERAAMATEKVGFEKVKQLAWELGRETRAMMAGKGLKSVAAKGYEAPGVVVSYTDDPTMFAKFKAKGFQIAAGVPFMINEPAGNNTFRIGLFGLDKIVNRENTVSTLEPTLEEILRENESASETA